jgi:thioredoxin reductase (NADPH)
VLGAGWSRANWIPESHNTTGLPDGVGGPEFLARLREQAGKYGVESRQLRADRLTRAGDVFEVSSTASVVQAPCVLIATGVLDRMPALPGLAAAVRRSLVRMCPICDAYEAIGERIAVLGDDGLAEREAAFLRSYSDHVTVVGEQDGDLELAPTEVRWTRPDATGATFDRLYLALGCEPQSALAAACGARCDPSGSLVVDAHQMTSVDGLFAAGDVVRGLNQIAVATGEAAVAATAMHNRLRGVKV